MLNNIQDDLFELVEFMNLKENYLNVEFRNEIVREFYLKQSKYNLVRNYLNKQILSYNSNNEEELPDINEIYYLVRDANAEKAYIEGDIKDISPDLLDDVKRLIISLRKNTLSVKETKKLTALCSGYRELKDDQLRIIYKHLEGNKFVIIGCGMKKTDNDLNLYKKMRERQLLPNKLALFSDVENDLFNMFDEKKVHGGRKNA